MKLFVIKASTILTKVVAFYIWHILIWHLIFRTSYRLFGTRYI